MSHPQLNEIVSDLHRMEEAFHDNFSDNIEMFAANIINQRMIVYNMEKNMMNRFHTNSKRESNMATLYNYLNDYVENKRAPYRNLVLFEIDQLVGDKNCSPEEIEKYFILENCSMTVGFFMSMYYKETGVEINPYDIEVTSIEKILMDMGLNRKTALKFCVAAIAECFDKGEPEIIESIVGDKTDKFYTFYDTTVANHSIYDGDGFMLLLFLATFTYICESF